MTTEIATTQEDVKNYENRLFKEQIFDEYVIWKSIPAMFKNPPVDRKTGARPSVTDFLESMGVEDEHFIILCGLKNQNAFAERFNVHINTLTNWNAEMKKRNILDDIRTGWAKTLTKNVMTSFYNKAMREGDAPRVKLWAQLVEQWSEKSVVEHDYKGVKSITYDIVEPKHDEPVGDQKADQPEAGASAPALERPSN